MDNPTVWVLWLALGVGPAFGVAFGVWTLVRGRHYRRLVTCSECDSNLTGWLVRGTITTAIAGAMIGAAYYFVGSFWWLVLTKPPWVQ